MIVFNAGLPRSGTVLVGAIVRAMFEGEGATVTQHNPHGMELAVLLSKLLETRSEGAQVDLIHTHGWPDVLPHEFLANDNVTGFLCHRDPRDVCVSLMGLHDMTFEEAVEFTLGNLSLFYEMRSQTAWPTIDYRDLQGSKLDQIHGIAKHLGFQLSEERAHQIDDATSVARHRAIMERLRAGNVNHLIVRKNRHRDLREDAHSLINDRHIQSGEIGRWRRELSPEQQATVTATFASFPDLTEE